MSSRAAKPPGGIGETGATAGPPALRNAIYAATGVALRRLPIDRALDRRGRRHERAGAHSGQHRRDRSSSWSAVVALADLRGPGPLAFADGTNGRARRLSRAPIRPAFPRRSRRRACVKRGEYLARAADCLACHTAKGGKPYAGGLAFKLPFGTLYSTNITPDKETGIGNYSDQDFLNAVHRGVRRDGARLYPAMPYTSYTYMTDADALAIKAYLFSLPPVQRDAAREHARLSVQPALGDGVLVGAVQSATRASSRIPRKAPEWNRGAYLAEALAHCGECHTPRNLAFALDNRKKFAGAVTAGWRAYNITSDKTTGVGAGATRTSSPISRPATPTGHGTASGPMGEAVDESFSHLAPEDIHAIVAYLRTVPPMTSTDLPATLAPPAPRRTRKAARGGRARQDGLRGRLRQLPRLDAARARSRRSRR